MIKVHERVEEIRKEKRVPKAELARHLGMTAMGYHHLSTGRTPINTDRLQIIAEVLGVPASEFLRPELNGTFSA